MLRNSYLATILSAFAYLDIDELRRHLKDEYTYQDTTKEIFLSKLETIFMSLINSGNTEFLIFPGVCTSNTCEDCCKKGYRFIGEYSRDYLDLIFEMDEENILDIFDCEDLQTEYVIECLGGKYNIFLDLDDLVTFHKTPEYWSKVYGAEAAFNEIITNPPMLLDFEEISNWLDKHAMLNNLRIGNYDTFGAKLKWSPFSKLYQACRDFKLYISAHLLEFIQANISLKKIKNEDQLIEWIFQYETIYNEATFDLTCHIYRESINFRWDFTWGIVNPILFTGEDFLETCSFMESYRKHNDALLDKYNTLTAAEYKELEKSQGFLISYSNKRSLRFHLEERKALEDIGLHIPFYLK